MFCVIHMLGGRGKVLARFVLAGYSVCEDEACLNACSDDQHTTIMKARAI